MAYSICLRRLFSQGANNCATFRFPPLQGKILVVGDGDFSYSLACLRENQSNNGTARITATSLDSKMVAVKKYARARDNIAVLTGSTDATVLHSLDVTQTGSLGSKRVWESIVWNFPYPANVTQPLSQQGSTLLAGFFQSARGILKTDGAIYITMRTNRAEKAWGLEGVARTCGFTISKKIPFTASSIDGYEPKRVHCDKKIPNAESCTYVLHTTQTDLEVPVIPSFASDTEHDVCTAQKVCELLASNSNKIRLDQFKSVYQKHFGRPPVLLHSKRLKKSLEKLAFDVKQEGRTSWFLRQDLLKGQIKQKEIHELLASNNNKIRLAQFKSVYQKHFGRPPVLFHSKRLKKSLEKLAFDVKQEGRTSWFLRQDLLEGQIQQKEIHELLASNNNKIRLAQFKSVYQQHFGRPPVLLHSKRLKKSLEKLAFDVKQEGRTSWFLRQDLLEGQIQQKEIHELLASNNNKIRLDQFKSVYQKHFGRPPVLFHSKRLKKSLEKLAFDVKQEGRTSWFLRQDLLEGQIQQREIHELLASNKNRIRLARFKSIYQQHFGRLPVLP